MMLSPCMGQCCFSIVRMSVATVEQVSVMVVAIWVVAGEVSGLVVPAVRRGCVGNAAVLQWSDGAGHFWLWACLMTGGSVHVVESYMVVLYSG